MAKYNLSPAEIISHSALFSAFAILIGLVISGKLLTSLDILAFQGSSRTSPEDPTVLAHDAVIPDKESRPQSAPALKQLDTVFLAPPPAAEMEHGRQFDAEAAHMSFVEASKTNSLRREAGDPVPCLESATWGNSEEEATHPPKAVHHPPAQPSRTVDHRRVSGKESPCEGTGSVRCFLRQWSNDEHGNFPKPRIVRVNCGLVKLRRADSCNARFFDLCYDIIYPDDRRKDQ
ncbi:unnamed protein product [Notodromas monacha]|uniref:Uncharacterized protein n=1 Tax=Notodromas monacha TaxID=399045 RepID=A0A7R9BM33_9CRUS|nr:unnamed protein product [Notodromas monacha]CAG0917166.1 unnamed protein product [Notodromas monacha]